MNFAQLISTLQSYTPKWLVTVLSLLALSTTTYTLTPDDVSKIANVFKVEERGFNLTLPKQDLDFILASTQANQVGVWSHSYYVPESKSMTAEIRKNPSEHPNIIRNSIPVYDTPNQSLQHWSLRCYAGEPELQDLKDSEVSFIISCPIIQGTDINKQTLSGFLQLEFSSPPKDIKGLIGKVSRYTKTYKFK